jgi:hypothetical protein
LSWLYQKLNDITIMAISVGEAEIQMKRIIDSHKSSAGRLFKSGITQFV